MSLSSPELLAALRDLRQSIATEAARSIERWQSGIEQPSFVVSAGNLAHYLALRHHDLRDLQRELMRQGLSSLGRLESRVLLTLSTVESALGALVSGAHTAPDWPPLSEEFFGRLVFSRPMSFSMTRAIHDLPVPKTPINNSA